MAFCDSVNSGCHPNLAVRNVSRQVTQFTALIPKESRCTVHHFRESIGAGNVLITCGRVRKQFKTPSCWARNIDLVKVALDKLGVSAHLNLFIKVEDSGALSLSCPIVLAEDPVLTRPGTANESTIIGNVQTKVVNIRLDQINRCHQHHENDLPFRID